jgi:hypothetical protein
VPRYVDEAVREVKRFSESVADGLPEIHQGHPDEDALDGDAGSRREKD